jgi:Skp family chaperone for outer membrane proteins
VAIHSCGWRGTRLFLAVCSFAFLAASQANAANRIALVIGNNAYENVPQPQKAVNDAEAIAELSKATVGQQAKSDLVQPA